MIYIDRYDVGEQIFQYLLYAFNENTDLKELWKKEPLTYLIKSEYISDKNKRENLSSKKIINEALEYYIIELLSTHLTDYFNTIDKQNKEIKEYKREDIPEVLLTNRFLDLFSKPVSDRPKFSVQIPPGEILSSLHFMTSGMKPIYYFKFDLNLPLETKIVRTSNNCLQFNTKKFIIKLNTIFEGFNKFIPIGFIENYLKEDETNVIGYAFEIVIEIKLKVRGLIIGSGWEYYSWIDSFVEDLESKISFEQYFKEIGWEAAFTTIKSIGLSAPISEETRTINAYRKRREPKNQSS
jgi:hypothetical protein